MTQQPTSLDLDEIRRLHAELATARSEAFREAAELAQAEGTRLYNDRWPTAAQAAWNLAEKLRSLPAAEETHVVADDSSDPEHVDDCPGCEDTLPAWLYSRFINALDAPAWDALSDDDRAYWEHQARAVRRAVARGGFKAPAIPAL